MRFQPPHCPHPDCPSHATLIRGIARWGRYRRKCDGRHAQRFRCSACRRTFSAQAFRLDYRLRLPRLHLALWPLLISKVTHRQAARTLGCRRHTVAHRVELLGRHCREFHMARLRRLAAAGGHPGPWQLDELETYETDRRLQPLTVPVLIHQRSYFVVGIEVAPLPCRGGLGARDRKRKRQRESSLGIRRSGSRAAVERCLTLLRPVAGRHFPIVCTDRKRSYPGSLRRVLGGFHGHACTHSTRRRDRSNPLFPINHTLAQLRDGVSRLVRRTWAGSKRATWLERHLWIWVCWRNYVRDITNAAPGTTPAMVIGVAQRPLDREELLASKVLP